MILSLKKFCGNSTVYVLCLDDKTKNINYVQKLEDDFGLLRKGTFKVFTGSRGFKFNEDKALASPRKRPSKKAAANARAQKYSSLNDKALVHQLLVLALQKTIFQHTFQ